MSDIDKIRKIIEVLGFLGAMRDFGYIDRLATALNEVSVYESLNDALRAYLSLCFEKDSIEYKNKIYMCPKVSEDDLLKEIEFIKGSITGRSGAEIVRFSRELALRAYATIPTIKVVEKTQSSQTQSA